MENTKVPDGEKPVAGSAPSDSTPAPAAETAASQQAPVTVAAQPKAAAAPAIKKPKQDKAPENDPGIWRMNRRNFVNVAGWGAFFVFIATSTFGALRMMFPRILYEAPSAFKAGFPQDFLVGEVSEKYKDDYRVWIIRDADGFYALSAICTHLGCTPRWLNDDNKFKCPCHGSGFRRSGINFEGPAPRPLERLKISLSDDGQLLIDRAMTFRYENGDWTKPEAFLPFT
jgi:cytochrome b6-f complex iron-sulfur subunit